MRKEIPYLKLVVDNTQNFDEQHESRRRDLATRSVYFAIKSFRKGLEMVDFANRLEPGTIIWREAACNESRLAKAAILQMQIEQGLVPVEVLENFLHRPEPENPQEAG